MLYARCGVKEVEGKAKPATEFSVFEAFSFLLDDGLAERQRQHTMKPPTPTRPHIMDKHAALIKKFNEEKAKFEKTMEELRLLKDVAQDLKHYKRMIKIKKYD